MVQCLPCQKHYRIKLPIWQSSKIAVYREAKNLGTINDFLPEKLICGVLTSRPESIDQVTSELCSKFGSLDFKSDTIPFEFTDYYDEEMGTPIIRLFLAFEALVDPHMLAEIKAFTNSIEDTYSQGNKRRVNLDPGFISLKRLILASTKDNGRRIPLANGIYAEITLIFTDGTFGPVPWTYPDYRSERYIDVMKQIREIYKLQLKHR
jgi:hypothetical protein